MKKNPASLTCAVSAIIAALTMTAISISAASTDYWTGPNPGTTTSPTSGNWDTTSDNWTTTGGSGNTTFSTGNTVVFGGTDGEYGINVPASLSCAGITNNNSGYILTSSVPVTITTTATAAANVASGKTAVIGTNVTLNITANGSYVNQGTALAGQLIITNGGTITQPNSYAFAVDGAPGSMLRVLTGGVASHTGGGSAVRIGYTAGSSGILSIEGGTFNNTGSASFVISAGAPSTGTVSVVSGKLNVPKTPIVIGNVSTSVATNNLNGGIEIAEQIKTGSSSAVSVFNFNGGVLQGVNPGVSGLTNVFMNGLTAASVRNAASTIDVNGTPIVIGQALLHSTISGDNATDGGLIVTNSGAVGSLALTNANTYNGPTIVTAGANLITTTLSSGSGSYTIADGGTLDLQVAMSGQSLPMSALTLGVSGNVSNIFVLGANASTTVPAVTVAGALNLNGTVGVTVTGNGLTGPNTYVLMSYSSIGGSGSFVPVALPVVAGYVGTLTNDTVNKQLKLVYSTAPQPVKWAVGSGTWDTTSLNWQLLAGSGPTNYVEGSLVAFDDTASGSSPITVTLAANRSPNSISNNATKTYIFAGTGNVLGGGSLTENGAGMLVLDNGGGNTFSSIAINNNNGMLQLGANDTGGSLGAGAIADSGTLAFNRTDNPVVNNAISGTGNVAQNGAGVLALAGANTYSGLTIVNSGQLLVSNTAALQNSTLSNNVVGGVLFGSSITSLTAGGLAGTGDIGLTNESGAALTFTVGGNGSTAYSGNLIGGGAGSILQQGGAGALSLSGNDGPFANFLVAGQGSLAVTGGSIVTTNFQVNANGSMVVSGGTVTDPNDGRIQAANGTWDFTGGTLHFCKLVIGNSTSASNGVLVTVSGNAQVLQDQADNGNTQRQLWVGGNNSGSGSILLKNNASWQNTQTIASDENGNPIVAIGNNGTGQGALTIQDNATFYYDNVIEVGVNTANIGTVNLNGGTLSATGFSHGAGTATINPNGGTIQALASSSSFFANFNSISILSNGLAFDNGGNTVTITNQLAGTGGLTSLDTGTLTLTGSNTYTGPTVVTGGGTLALTTSGASSSYALTDATLDITNLVVTNSSFAMTNATLQLAVVSGSPTNLVTGAFSTGGSANQVAITAYISQQTNAPLIRYTSLGAGVVDANNNLTTLTLNPPPGFTGYLTNDVANDTIDVVFTSGSFLPTIVTNPVSALRFKGGNVQFSVVAIGATGYQWQFSTDDSTWTPLTDGPAISGSASNILSLSNLTLGEAGYYEVLVTNNQGSVLSTPATLTVFDTTNYPGTNVLLGAVHYYQLNESSTTQPAYDSIGGVNGVYGADAEQTAGPDASVGYPGFEDANVALVCAAPFATANVAISNSWNIDTNTVSLVCWVYPVTAQSAFTGVVFDRGDGMADGLDYSPNTNAVGDYTLGYNWNNDPNNYNWDSGLVPPLYQWSMVALVITPTNATIYLGTTNGLISSTHTYPHPVQDFDGPILIGSDPTDPGGRSFTGYLDEVASFGTSLTETNIMSLLEAATEQTNFPPVVVTQPSSLEVYQHQTAQFDAQVAGVLPMSYQWMRGSGGNYTNVPSGTTPDGSIISGATDSTLVVSNTALSDAADYVLLATNMDGSTTSIVATLRVDPSLPATNITTAVIEAAGDDWDTANTWDIDGSAVSGGATQLAGEYYGSTFTIQAPGGIRTPNFNNPGSPTSASFPGNVLIVQGNGTYDTTLTNAGAIRIKGGNPSTVYFPDLVLAGGQLCNILNSGWPAIITGEMDVVSNSAVWASDDTSPRSITIQATLTGSGGILYHAYNDFTTFQASSSASLNISNANNTYTGTWDVQLGILVGSAPNALGTNSITVEAQGALQTTYDIDSPNATLVLNGQMNLTQNDTFQQVSVNGTALSPGTYSFGALNAAYPANFPATWTGFNGALNATNASGSITVLGQGSLNPGTIGINRSGGSLQLTWTNANTLLLSATNLLGPWVTNTGATSPFTVTNTVPKQFFRLQSP